MKSDENAVPQELAAKVAELEADQGSVLDHGVWWKPARWGAADLGPLAAAVGPIASATKGDEDGWQMIRRHHVAALADPAAQFLAAMIRGFGPVGYGPSRVTKIVRAAGDRLVPSVEGIQAAARSGTADAWDAFKTTHKLKWLGPAFATKVAYFATLDDDQPPTGPLIADLNTSWAMYDLVELERSFECRDSYLDYVERARGWAEELGCRPDDVERALFELGKDVRERLR